ncbi:MAG: OmpH family outer membrane protein [Pseudomonadota bacterium]
MNTNLQSNGSIRNRFTAITMAFLVTIAAIPSAVLAQSGPSKIAVVDLDRAIAGSPMGRTLQAKLEKFQKDAQVEVEALNAQARNLRQQVVDGANSLSEDRLAELRKSFEDKQIEIRRLSDDKNRELQKIRGEGLLEIEKALEPVLTKIRDDNGYDVIFNNTTGVVLLVGARANITDLVIERLNAG